MNRRSLLAFLMLLVSSSSLAADPEPYLKSAPMPFYPPLCRSARISGKVTIHFTINEQGDTSEVEAGGGHQLLREAAVQNVQNWKFGWSNPCNCRVKKNVIFIFSLNSHLDENGPSSVVRWFGKSPVKKIEIEAPGATVWQP